ncbi:hypothetical protein Tco_1512515 [Tanacetum coccineum]
MRGQSHRKEAVNSSVIYVSGSGADGYDNADVMMVMSVEELLDWIIDSGSSYYITYRRDYTDEGWVKFRVGQRQIQLGKIKVIKGSLMALSGIIRANCVCTLYGHAVTKKTLKGRKHLGDWVKDQDGAEDTTMSTYLVNRVPSPVIRFKTPIDMLGFLVGLLVLSNGCLNRLRLSAYSWDIVKSGEYKKTFIGSGVGTGSVQVLQGVEFEVEPQEDHAFEDLMDYHSTHDREQHSTRELFRYREDSNEAAFVVAEAEKIYAHESLNFNDTVACELISKWKTRLKEEMDARSYVYVLSNGGRKSSNDCEGYY